MEDKDIELIEETIRVLTGKSNTVKLDFENLAKVLEKILQAYKQDEIIIDRLAGAVAFYRNDSVKAVKEEYRKLLRCE
jgi:hypothetical protein